MEGYGLPGWVGTTAHSFKTIVHFGPHSRDETIFDPTTNIRGNEPTSFIQNYSEKLPYPSRTWNVPPPLPKADDCNVSWLLQVVLAGSLVSILYGGFEMLQLLGYASPAVLFSKFLVHAVVAACTLGAGAPCFLEMFGSRWTLATGSICFGLFVATSLLVSIPIKPGMPLLERPITALPDIIRGTLLGTGIAFVSTATATLVHLHVPPTRKGLCFFIVWASLHLSLGACGLFAVLWGSRTQIVTSHHGEDFDMAAASVLGVMLTAAIIIPLMTSEPYHVDRCDWITKMVCVRPEFLQKKSFISNDQASRFDCRNWLNNKWSTFCQSCRDIFSRAGDFFERMNKVGWSHQDPKATSGLKAPPLVLDISEGASQSGVHRMWFTVTVLLNPLLLSTPLWVFDSASSAHEQLSAHHYAPTVRWLGWTKICSSLGNVSGALAILLLLDQVPPLSGTLSHLYAFFPNYESIECRKHNARTPGGDSRAGQSSETWPGSQSRKSTVKRTIIRVQTGEPKACSRSERRVRFSDDEIFPQRPSFEPAVQPPNDKNQGTSKLAALTELAQRLYTSSSPPDKWKSVRTPIRRNAPGVPDIVNVAVNCFKVAMGEVVALLILSRLIWLLSWGLFDLRELHRVDTVESQTMREIPSDGSAALISSCAGEWTSLTCQIAASVVHGGPVFNLAIPPQPVRVSETVIESTTAPRQHRPLLRCLASFSGGFSKALLTGLNLRLLSDVAESRFYYTATYLFSCFYGLDALGYLISISLLTSVERLEISTRGMVYLVQASLLLLTLSLAVPAYLFRFPAHYEAVLRRQEGMLSCGAERRKRTYTEALTISPMRSGDDSNMGSGEGTLTSWEEEEDESFFKLSESRTTMARPRFNATAAETPAAEAISEKLPVSLLRFERTIFNIRRNGNYLAPTALPSSSDSFVSCSLAHPSNLPRGGYSQNTRRSFSSCATTLTLSAGSGTASATTEFLEPAAKRRMDSRRVDLQALIATRLRPELPDLFELAHSKRTPRDDLATPSALFHRIIDCGSTRRSSPYTCTSTPFTSASQASAAIAREMRFYDEDGFHDPRADDLERSAMANKYELLCVVCYSTMIHTDEERSLMPFEALCKDVLSSDSQRRTAAESQLSRWLEDVKRRHEDLFSIVVQAAQQATAPETAMVAALLCKIHVLKEWSASHEVFRLQREYDAGSAALAEAEHQKHMAQLTKALVEAALIKLGSSDRDWHPPGRQLLYVATILMKRGWAFDICSGQRSTFPDLVNETLTVVLSAFNGTDFSSLENSRSLLNLCLFFDEFSRTASTPQLDYLTWDEHTAVRRSFEDTVLKPLVQISGKLLHRVLQYSQDCQINILTEAAKGTSHQMPAVMLPAALSFIEAFFEWEHIQMRSTTFLTSDTSIAPTLKWKPVLFETATDSDGRQVTIFELIVKLHIVGQHAIAKDSSRSMQQLLQKLMFLTGRVARVKLTRFEAPTRVQNSNCSENTGLTMSTVVMLPLCQNIISLMGQSFIIKYLSGTVTLSAGQKLLALEEIRCLGDCLCAILDSPATNITDFFALPEAATLLGHIQRIFPFLAKDVTEFSEDNQISAIEDFETILSKLALGIVAELRASRSSPANFVEAFKSLCESISTHFIRDAPYLCALREGDDQTIETSIEADDSGALSEFLEDEMIKSGLNLASPFLLASVKRYAAIARIVPDAVIPCLTQTIEHCWLSARNSRDSLDKDKLLWLFAFTGYFLTEPEDLMLDSKSSICIPLSFLNDASIEVQVVSFFSGLLSLLESSTTKSEVGGQSSATPVVVESLLFVVSRVLRAYFFRRERYGNKFAAFTQINTAFNALNCVVEVTIKVIVAMCTEPAVMSAAIIGILGVAASPQNPTITCLWDCPAFQTLFMSVIDCGMHLENASAFRNLRPETFERLCSALSRACSPSSFLTIAARSQEQELQRSGTKLGEDLVERRFGQLMLHLDPLKNTLVQYGADLASKQAAFQGLVGAALRLAAQRLTNPHHQQQVMSVSILLKSFLNGLKFSGKSKEIFAWAAPLLEIAIIPIIRSYILVSDVVVALLNLVVVIGDICFLTGAYEARSEEWRKFFNVIGMLTEAVTDSLGTMGSASSNASNGDDHSLNSNCAALGGLCKLLLYALRIDNEGTATASAMSAVLAIIRSGATATMLDPGGALGPLLGVVFQLCEQEESRDKFARSFDTPSLRMLLNWITQGLVTPSIKITALEAFSAIVNTLLRAQNALQNSSAGLADAYMQPVYHQISDIATSTLISALREKDVDSQTVNFHSEVLCYCWVLLARNPQSLAQLFVAFADVVSSSVSVESRDATIAAYQNAANVIQQLLFQYVEKTREDFRNGVSEQLHHIKLRKFRTDELTPRIKVLLLSCRVGKVS